MSLSEKLVKQEWAHDAGDDRVEHLCAFNPDLAERLPKLALRFISEKGLSEEFADILEEIEARDTASSEASPAP